MEVGSGVEKKVEKAMAYFLLGLLLLSMLPVIYLGRYNHPTGDDYYYGVEAHRAWEQTGNPLAVASAALQGVAYDYQTWQGTYSALFLMHMPPNAFGEGAYHFVTLAILLLFCGGLFYLLKPLICNILSGSTDLWILVSSLLSLLCIQTVPSQGETFFWYNGSMYYTGYLGVTFFFFGLVCRYLQRKSTGKMIWMICLALFLAGGNYVSLLPALLILILLTGALWLQKKEGAKDLAVVSIFLLLGLFISMAAPGNAVRQSDMWKIPAWKAILKSLLQGFRYLLAWIRGFWVLAALAVTPFLWKQLERMQARFPYPLLVIGLSYGIFCSMSCPTFYTMNSTGPARAVAIVYYCFVLVTFFLYFYLLGYLQRILREKKSGKKWEFTSLKKGMPVFVGIFCLVIFVAQCVNGKVQTCTTAKAISILVSGEGASYEEEHQRRMDLLLDESLVEVVLPAFSNQPDMLYVGDLSTDPLEETNRKVAEYFGKESVCVSEP